MTDFQPIRFDPVRCAAELDELAALLRAHPLLAERRQILPFFRARPQLTAFLGSCHPDLTAYDRVAYELRLFGAFTADVVVGDWDNKAFCSVEFEEADPGSVFARGFGQVVDWFWKLADLQGTAAFARLFGAPAIDAAAIVVVGRDADVVGTDRAPGVVASPRRRPEAGLLLHFQRAGARPPAATDPLPGGTPGRIDPQARRPPA